MHRLTAPLLLTPLLLLAACGGDDPSTVTAPGSSSSASATASASAAAGQTKAQYLATMDGLCERGKTQIDAIAEPTSPAQFTTFVDRTLAVASTTTDALVQATADYDDRATVERLFLTPLKGQVAALKASHDDVIAAVADGNLDDLEEPKLPEVDEAALTSYGFSAACADIASED